MNTNFEKKAGGFAWLTGLLVGASLLAQACGDGVLRMLQWESGVWASGEWWRMATGHLAHWSWDHWVWDAMTVGVLGWYLEKRGRRRAMGVTLAVTVVATESLLRWSGSFDAYRGLSGIAVGLFGLAVWEFERAGAREGAQWKRWVGIAAGVGLVAKVGVEFLEGTPVFVDASAGGYALAVEAHLAGMIGAVFGGLFLVR